MHLHFGAVLSILLCVAATADPGSYSGSGSTGDNAGHDGGVVYLPVESLQNDLLNTTGLVPDSLVAVTATYEALKDGSTGLAGVTAPNTTRQFSSFRRLPRTKQRPPMSFWPYTAHEDSNVLKLETFQQFLSNGSTDIATPGNTTESRREIVAIASILVSDCIIVQKTAVGRPVVGNEFFGTEFSSDPAFFYSTDLNNIIHSNDVSPSSAETNKTRRLELGAFGFVEDPECTYKCGEEDAPVDECWAVLDGQYTTRPCQLQFYEQNPDCNHECGNKVGELAFLPASQCYKCEFDVLFGCDDGLTRADWRTCCLVLTCDPVVDTTVTNPKGLTWNLHNDGETIIDSSYVIYEDGDCSDPTDFSSNCCRITCEDCYVRLSVESLYADVDVYGTFSEFSTSRWQGKSYLRVKIFAPNGCDIEDVHTAIDKTATLSFYSGTDLELNIQLDILKRLSLKPHGTSVEFGVTTDIEGATAGYLNSNQFFDIQMTSTPVKGLAQSGLDIEVEVAAIPSLSVSLSFLGGIAEAGIKTRFAMSAELNAGLQYPGLYPALSTEYLDPESAAHYGDCSEPHFMEFKGYAGFKDITLSLPLSIDIPLIGGKTWEPTKNFDNKIASIVSGCIATAYEAEMLLSTAISAVSSLSDDKQQKLKEIVMWLLGISEIDPDFLAINYVSPVTGEISIKIAVPPSVADTYPTSSDLRALLYERARTTSFSNAVSDYVGLEVNAQCDSGSWGPTCENSCDLGHCGEAVCNPVDGVTISCSYCEDGYWGPTCEESCNLPTHCISSSCPQSSETATGCSSCEEGWGGHLCADSTTTKASTGTQTGSASTWVAQGPLVFISATGLVWLL